MHLFALVILACTASGDCQQQTVEHGLTRAACSAQLLHTDPKLACQAEKRQPEHARQLASVSE